MHREGTLRRSNQRAQIIFLGISVLILLLLILPASSLEGFPVLCVWRALGFSHCWGCGMTHAFWHLLHGEFKIALSYNWRIVLVAPIVGWFYLNLGYESLTGNPLPLKFLHPKIF